LLPSKHLLVSVYANLQTNFMEKGDRPMEKTGIILGLVLVLAVPVAGALASGGTGFASHSDAVSFSSTGNGPAIQPAGFSLCPTIAETAQVRNKGIDYVRTREFAEAVSAVANGTSSFAPIRVPAEWKGAATLWGSSVTSNGTPRIAVMQGEAGPGRHQVVLLSPSGVPIDPTRIGLEERSCNSDLLFRASLEYRFRKGQEDAPLLYPHLVRKAASGIEKKIMAKMDSATRSAKRADDIAARILQAEKAGAGECQPQELARAKAELAVALGGISDINIDAGVTDTVLARAERATADLMSAGGRFASINRIYCGP
jgi:hypothetical protein